MSDKEHIVFGGDPKNWEAAEKITKESTLSVLYWSKRAEEMRRMNGEVVGVDADESGVIIELEREDDQLLRITRDGDLLSIGSNFPNNGPVISIVVDN